MKDFTLLEFDQIVGKNQLEIFENYNERASVTDFAILLGAYVSDNFYTCEGASAHNRTGWYWTKSFDINGFVLAVNSCGQEGLHTIFHRDGGVRPAVAYSSIRNKCLGEVTIGKKITQAIYGEYPQTVVSDSELSRILEYWYNEGGLLKTGKKYTVDSETKISKNLKFKPRVFEEYDFQNKKYIRFVGDFDRELTTLSDGRKIEKGKPYWVEVENIIWLVDEKTDTAITKKSIVSGLQFNQVQEPSKDFSKTSLKKFLNECFGKEIVGEMTVLDYEANESKIKKQNPYNFDMREVSEEDIIKSAIESNIAVFLHGRSSEGKSARVKQLDPDCEIIYLRNATPDSLNGKSVYNASTGDMIDVPPTWYKKIVAKCEAEPDKLHILFFDEITNALPSIQGMAFNIILDKEVNGIWKLPSNCRIVAAGNDLNDSLAANTMAEPLFNRFAHVYIETKVNDWLKWAITENGEYERLDNVEVKEKRMKIHPAIYAYIAYKGENALRTKFDGIKPNADPRKWELASKMLYKSNNPNTLRALVGEELTKEFTEFCKISVITLEDVISGNYEEQDLRMDISIKYMTAVGLSKCEEKDIEVVRKFVAKLGKEVLATFDGLWSKGNKERLEKLAELSANDDFLEEESKIEENSEVIEEDKTSNDWFDVIGEVKKALNKKR